MILNNELLTNLNLVPESQDNKVSISEEDDDLIMVSEDITEPTYVNIKKRKASEDVENNNTEVVQSLTKKPKLTDSAVPESNNDDVIMIE